MIGLIGMSSDSNGPWMPSVPNPSAASWAEQEKAYMKEMEGLVYSFGGYDGIMSQLNKLRESGLKLPALLTNMFEYENEIGAVALYMYYAGVRAERDRSSEK